MGLLSLVVVVLFVFGKIMTGCRVHGYTEDYITWDDFSVREEEDQYGKFDAGVTQKRDVIVVSKDGTGDSMTVQGGVDMVPHGNKERVKIVIRPGVYREKVVIPITKPYISLIGDHSSQTIISWNNKASDRDAAGKAIGTLKSATIAVESNYCTAYGITFENTAALALPGSDGQQAVALRVSGDKCMFFRCSIKGSQDTLFDHYGRHYFHQCYIEGSIDFIFGRGRSLYQQCSINATASSYGAIAASQRNEPWEDAGFSFVKCKIRGSGSIYLGRAWGRYATIVFSMCSVEDIINPQGWYDWGDPTRRRTVMFGEYNCTGRGASLRGRVPWAKSLSYEQAKPFMGRDFIDGDYWLRL